MATLNDFSAMLNEYLPNELLKEEFIKRDYLLNKVEKDNNWRGGDLIVPFEGASASSVSFGSLTASADISKYQYVRGSITNQPEMWGSLAFNHTDLMKNNKVDEQSFLKILPGQIDSFIQYCKEVASVNMLGAAHFASVTDATNAATGVMIVDKIDRFTIGQLVTLVDSGTAQADYFVTAINVNTSAIILSATSGGGPANVSAYSVAEAAKFYHPGILVAGVITNNFTSLRSALLSLANGGSTTLHGQTKTAYPYLQAVNVSGASISATNIVEKIFDAWTSVRNKSRGGKADTVLLSYKHLGSVMKIVETQKGGFKVSAGQTAVNQYGWTEIQITTVRGVLTIVGVQEMDDDVIMIIDWSALKFYSNGLFKKRVSPDGKEYFEERATTGYRYLVDVCLFGDLVVKAPSKCGIIYSVANY